MFISVRLIFPHVLFWSVDLKRVLCSTWEEVGGKREMSLLQYASLFTRGEGKCRVLFSFQRFIFYCHFSLRT